MNKSMSSKKSFNRAIKNNTNGGKYLYKYFVFFSIILLIGIFLPEYFGVHYLAYSFIYIIVFPLCIVSLVYFKLVKRICGASLYISCWASFCVVFTSYTIFNALYANKQEERFFLSTIEQVIHSGYRTPPSLLFSLEDSFVALVVKNEYPIKEKIEAGHVVKISGYYKRGLLSSVMIVDYTID